MSKYIKRTLAFTLVELIVSIVIIIILATIAFNSYSWYSVKSRDSVRIVDIDSMNNSLEISFMNTWYYPVPSNPEEITYSWAIVWTQWTIWESVIRNLNENRQVPVDPLTWNEYAYSVLNNWKEYQLASIIEEMAFESNSIFETANAWDDIGFAYVIWNFNWMFAQVRVSSKDYFLSVPSIISSTIDTLENIISNNNFVVNWFSNLPANYASSDFNLNWSSSSEFLNAWEIDKIVYNWCVTSLIKNIDFDTKKSIIINLQNQYTWTTIANNKNIKYLLSLDTSTENDELTKYINYLFNSLIIIPWCIELDYYCDSTSYPHTNTVVWTPTEADQAWQNTDSSNPCYFTCDTNYTWDWTDTCNAATQTATCVWNVANSDWNTATEISQTWDWFIWAPSSDWEYDTLASTTDCKYKCFTDYTWDWDSCEIAPANSCAAQPSYANATYSLWTATEVDQTWSHNQTPWNCTFACDANFTWNWTDTCVADTRDELCTWDITNSVWNTASSIAQTWNWSAWAPTLVWTYNTTASTTNCIYQCDSGYTWNWSDTCEVAPANSCNDTTKPADNWHISYVINPTSADQTYVLDSSECWFSCDINYTWNWTDACEADTRTEVCSWNVTNSVWNTASNITQTWDWSTWTPTLVWTYNTTSSTTECRYTCDSGFTWNWTTCEIAWPAMELVYNWLLDWDTIGFPFIWITEITDIDWWDGWVNWCSTTLSIWAMWLPPGEPSTTIKCTYANAWDYIIKIYGTSEIFGMSDLVSGAESIDKLISVNTWDWLWLTDLSYAFDGASNLITVPSTLPTNVTDLTAIFKGASSFNWDLSSWNTSNVTAMEGMFADAISFNQSLSNFNTSNVTAMGGMFANASVFNQNLNTWDTSNVTTMSNMFNSASSFNWSLSNWNTSNVTSMYAMFASAIAFDQSLSSFDTSKVTTMAGMFYHADVFNQSVSNFDTSSVTTMEAMFAYAYKFNQSVSNFDTSSVTTMEAMFNSIPVFNQSLSNFDTSSVTTMEAMFYDTSIFNQDISCWDVSYFSSEPPGFSINSSLISGNKPVWWTVGCPATDWACWDYNLTDQYNILHFTSENSCSIWTISNLIDNWLWTTYQWDCEWLNWWNPVSCSANHVTAPDMELVYNWLANWDIIDLKFKWTVNITNIDWWDGWEWCDTTATAGVSCTYSNPSAWDHIIKINGSSTGYGGIYPNGSDKLIAVNTWDWLWITDFNYAFSDASSLTTVPSTLPVGVTDMTGMFSGASIFNWDLSNWDTSSVTTMQAMFDYAISFNQDLSTWDTSSVTNMRDLFYHATLFNWDLSNWNTSNVTTMTYMFFYAEAFNQSLAHFDTSNVTDMESTFSYASLFNQSLSTWNTSSVNNMMAMFNEASDFSRIVECWNVINVPSEPTDFYNRSGIDKKLLPIWWTDWSGWTACD